MSEDKVIEGPYTFDNPPEVGAKVWASTYESVYRVEVVAPNVYAQRDKNGEIAQIIFIHPSRIYPSMKAAMNACLGTRLIESSHSVRQQDGISKADRAYMEGVRQVKELNDGSE